MYVPFSHGLIAAVLPEDYQKLKSMNDRIPLRLAAGLADTVDTQR